MTTIYLSAATRLEGPCAATIGFFDGVHRGHRYVVEQLRRLARERGWLTAVVTFDRHPRQVLHDGWQPQLLTTLAEKEALLAATGVDRLVVLPFTGTMAALGARQFMEQVLLGQLGVRLLLTGYDNHFGHREPGQQEGFAHYVAYGRAMGMEVAAAPSAPYTVEGQPLSSSLVRRLLGEGKVEEAACCLGRPYTLGGCVVHGEEVGRRLGFPTANLDPDDGRMIPRSGVYAVRVDGFGIGVTNIGTRPTFDGHQQTIETHLFDYHGDLYGQRLTIAFMARLRSEQHFDTPEALARQMAADAQTAKKLLTLNS